MERTHLGRLRTTTVVVVAMLLVMTTLTPAASAGPNDIEGTVFRDRDFDGASVGEAGQQGIEVKAIDAAGNEVSTFSGADGTYSLNVATLGTPVTVQFSIPADLDYLRPGPMGDNNRSDVRIANGGDTAVDFGVVNPAHFCQENPDVVTSCYIAGDQTGGGEVMVRTQFLAQGDGLGGGTPETIVADAAVIGTTYGIAVQTFNDRDPANDVIWAASFMKRFAGYGPGGPGAIYQLSQAGAELGRVTLAAGADPHDFSVVSGEVPDGASYAEVGKQGFGDLDISEDQTKIYAVNLADRALYEIDVDPTSGTYRSVLRSWPLGALGPCGGTLRPGGLGINDGTVYVGTTCDDGTVAYVHSLDLDTGAGTLELTIPLTYAREFVGNNSGLTAEWRAWNDDFVADETGWFYPEAANPQPWLSDIDFGSTGMVIGIRDRYGDQSGEESPSPEWPNDLDFPNLYSTDAAGDVLFACANGAAYELEGTGSCTVTNGGAGGPGGPEWFDGDIYLTGGVPGHEEISLGGVFVHPQSDEVLITAYDALDDNFGEYAFSQGLARLDPISGDKIGQYRVTDAPFGKAAGLGELEGFCLGAQVEIGNYVWIDADGDGIQDPDELPLPGVVVINTVTGENVTTGADGYYAFTLNPGDNYNLTFDISSVTAADPALLVLTGADQGTDDELDSDATVIGAGLPTITGIAGSGGDNDHSHDVGFVLSDNRIGNLMWLDIDNNAAVDAGEPGIAGVTVQLFEESGDAVGFDAADVAVATTTTDGTGNYWFDGLADAGTFYVAVPADQTANTVTVNGATINPAAIMSSTGGDLANNDIDNIDDGDPAAGFLTVSGPIDLIDGAEVEGETDANTGTGAEAYVEGAGSIDLDDNDSNLTVDLGFSQKNRIGNLVWLDGVDGQFGFNDGIAAATEAAGGIQNVTVLLFEDSTTGGTPGVYDPGVDLQVGTTTTDVDGSYWFEGVDDGTYFVGIPSGQTGQTINGTAADLDDYLSSTAPTSAADAAIDDRDDGAPAPGFASLSGALTAGLAANPVDEAGDFADPTDNGAETDINTKGSFFFDENSDLTVDFGFVEAPKYALGNLVWIDANDDGIAQDGEPGIEGVTVELYDAADNLVATTTTGLTGAYMFEDLAAADYRVSIPSGQTGQLVDGVATDLADLLISAVVANDPDDPTDIDNDNNGIDTAGTATSGLISIGNPDVFNPSEPTNETLRSDDATDDDDGGTTTDAQRNFTVDFGYVEPLRVGNLVWLDDGGASGGVYTAADEDDGFANTGEQGIGGVLVQLLDDTGVVVAETVTTGTGNYWFNGLRADDYQVGVPANQTPVLAPLGGINPTALDGLGSSTGQSVAGEIADDDDDGEAVGPYASLSQLFTLDYGTEAEDEAGDFANATDNAAEDAANAAGPNHLDENSNLEIDLGFAPTPTYRIGNLVWEETDGDGIAETGEDGVAGLLVQLLDVTATVIAETATDADGHYEFDELAAGSYQVRVPDDQTPLLAPQPDVIVGRFDDFAGSGPVVGDADNNLDNDNNGVPDATGLTSGLVVLGDNGGNNEPSDEVLRNDSGTLDEDGALPDDRSNLTVDFALQPLYRLGNLIWEDYDNDGIAEDLEPGIAGILVQLLDDGGAVLAETVTDATGHYIFADLVAGDYRVNIPATQTPVGDPQPDIVPGALDGLTTSGTPQADANNGTDNDNNGVENGADLLSGLVTLGDGDGANEPTGETLRDDDGTLDENGDLQDDRSDLTIDFGLFRGLRLGNQVFLDGQQGDGATYDNGIFDPGELGISGAEVELWLDDGDGIFEPTGPNGDALVATTTTDNEGNYSFGNIEPGAPYIVALETIGDGSASTVQSADPLGVDNGNDGAVDVANGYDSVTDVIVLVTGATALGEVDANPAADGSADDEANLIGATYPDQNSDMSVDLGFIDVPLYRIGNLVWEDLDNDGLAEDGELGIGGVTVELLDATGTYITETVTDGDGKYTFPLLLSGEYQVSIPMDQPALAGKDSTNNGEEADPNADVDNNDNGLVDGNAWTSGLIDVGVGAVAPNFGTEPDDETLRFDLTDPADDDDPDVGFYSDTLSNYSVDFGFLDVPKYELGNLVWVDVNDDGMADALEPGIGGVVVDLYDDADMLVDSQTTAPDGSYLFTDLDAGDYRVEIAGGQMGQAVEGDIATTNLSDLLPSVVVATNAGDDNDNDSNGVEDSADGTVTSSLISLGDPDELNPSEPTDETDRVGGSDEAPLGLEDDLKSNLTVDFGFVQPVRVGNLVWLDDGAGAGTYDATLEDNGIADAGEIGIAGILVQLIDNNDVVIAETVTDPAGNYWFDKLRPGNYQVGIPEDQTPTLGAQAGIIAGALDNLRSSTGISATGEFADDDDDGDPDTGFVTISDQFRLDFGLEAEDEGGDFDDTADNAAEDAANLGTVPHLDANSNLEIDLGLAPTPTYRLGNFVWEDFDNDGLAETDEPGLVGVLVQLRDMAGDVIAETVTDPDGKYEFDGLEAGDYSVRIPADQVPELGAQPDIVAGVLDGLNSSGTPNATADDDADNDNNGIQSAAGFTSGVVTLGDGTGNVEPTDETTPDGGVAGDDEDGALRDDRSNLTVDFGLFRGLRLGNQVFLDGKNGDPGYNDGIFNPAGANEVGISGADVQLWLDDGDGIFEPTGVTPDTLVSTVTTDSEGNYTFGNMLPDTGYFVAIEDIGDGFASTVQSTDPVTVDNDNDGAIDAVNGYDSVTDLIQISTGAATIDEVDANPAGDGLADDEADLVGDAYPNENSELTIDLGFIDVPLYRIGNLVWDDLDNDGLAEDGELGLGGVTVELLDATGAYITETVTDGDGKYEFPLLVSGEYQVSIPMDQPVLDAKASSNNGEEVDPNDDADNNDNGLVDGDAWTSGLIDVGVGATPPNFGTEPDDETLRGDLTDPADDDDPDAGFYTDDMSNFSVDFGFLDIPQYSIGNLVWIDTNDDGMADPGEPGIGNVTVQLFDDADVLVTSVQTDPDGSYIFEDLDAGDYSVVIDPAQAAQTIDDGGAGIPVDLQDLLTSSAVANDPDDPSDVDNDNNGVEQVGGLLNSGLISVGNPDELNPTEPTDEEDRLGGTDIDASNDVDDAKYNATVDFGFVEPLRVGNLVWLDDGAAAGTYTPTNEDNGLADGGEVGIEGVLVQLIEGGLVVGETVTDGAGNYWFDDLRKGDYRVGIPAIQQAVLDPQPGIIAGATDGLQSSTGQSVDVEDGDDDDDGDVTVAYLSISSTFDLDHDAEPDNETGDFDDTTVDAAENAANAATTTHNDNDSNLAVDLGLAPIPVYRIGDLVWEDIDDDGIAEDGEPGIRGVLVQLLDDAGDVIAETVTNGSGLYSFEDLPAGNYQVRLPAEQTPELGAQAGLVDGVLDGLMTAGTPEPDADGDVDNDNNGQEDADGFTSGVVSLGEGNTQEEPVDETFRSDSGALVEDGTIRDDRSNLTVDFGLFRGLRLGNQVFLDGEQGEPGYNNGLFDTTETGIGGLEVELWQDDGDGVFEPTGPAADTLVSTTTTDSEGNYSFGNVESATPYFVAIEDAGPGTVSEVVSVDPAAADNDNDAAPAGGYDAVSQPVTLTTGANSENESDAVPDADGPADTEADAAGDSYPDANSEMRVDIGLIDVPLYRIGNLVWDDIDNDGLAEVGEAGIEGVAVQLLVDGVVVDEVTTLADGSYEFPNQVAGDYQVSIPADQPTLEGYLSSNQGEEADPNDDVDNNDNGIDQPDAWTSGVIELGPDPVQIPLGTEPNDETERSDDPTDVDDDDGFYNDDRSNYSVDFGFYQLSLGSQVWYDADGDGQLDGDEAGVNDVPVILYEVADDGSLTQVDETTTATINGEPGSYVFDTLEAGTPYVVEIPAAAFEEGGPLDGLHSSPDPDSGAVDPDDDPTDGDDNGTDALPGEPVQSQPVVLQAGEEPAGEPSLGTEVPDTNENLAVDFGFYELVLGSQVWSDLDGDGVLDSGEMGVNDVPVILYEVADDGTLTQIDETTTATINSQPGSYVFDGLQDGSTYLVEIPASAFEEGGPLEGLHSSPDPETGPVDPDDDPTDGDDNGTDAEPGQPVQSQPVTLEVGGEPTGELSLETGVDDANENLGVDFGFYEMSLGSQVWSDLDGDGVLDANEVGVNDVPVILYEVADDGTLTQIAETTTATINAIPGSYLFESLQAGTTYVVEIPASAFEAGAPLEGLHSSPDPDSGPVDPDDDPTDGDDNGTDAAPGEPVQSQPIVLEAGGEPTGEPTLGSDVSDVNENLGVDFGFYEMSLGSQVWLDLDGDGILDADEVGIDGVPVILYEVGDHGVLTRVAEMTTTTINGIAGSYLFEGLQADVPYVLEIPASAFADGGPLDGLYSSPDPATGAADPDDDPTDGDDNGTDAPPGEAVQSLPVTLTVGGEPTSEPGLGSDVPDANENLGVDFGVTTLSLGGTLWEDLNEDGSLQDGEPVLAGVPVELWLIDPATGDPIGDEPIATTTTGPDGSYEFDQLLPGDYVVRIPASAMAATGPLTGMTSTVGNGVVPPDPDADPTDGDDNGALAPEGYVQSAPVTLSFGAEPTGEPEDGPTVSGNDNHTIDLGFVPTPPMSIGNRVFIDVDRSGVLDGDEQGVAGVEVWLIELPESATGEVLATVETNDDGYYLFEDLEPGAYVVQIPASNFVTGGPLVGFEVTDGIEPTNPDDDPTDNDNEGVEIVDGVVAEGVRSGPVTLVTTFEPTEGAETDLPANAHGSSVDIDSNLTIDFGFYLPPVSATGPSTGGDGFVPGPAGSPSTATQPPEPRPTEPLALTGGNRQLQQVLWAFGFISLGFVSLAVGHSRRRRETTVS